VLCVGPYVPLDDRLDTVSSTSSLKPKGDSQSRPSASACAKTSLPRRPTTSLETTSSGVPGSGGVRFGFFLRLGAVDLVVACVGDVERGRLSDERTGACEGDVRVERLSCIMERVNSRRP
jgi:hypothetical protein